MLEQVGRRIAFRETLEMLRVDRQRRAAVLITGIIGGLMVTCLVAHDSGAGADAYAYWTAVRTWLAGGDPYRPVMAVWPYAYPIWMLPLFLPWALIPWPLAWFVWRAAMVVLFCWSFGWAYRRRPLAAAVTFALLSAPIGVVLDSGNVSLFLTLGLWAAQFSGPRAAGFIWALATAMKWIPAVFLAILSPAARRWGLALLAVGLVLSLLTWQATLGQLEVIGLYGVPRTARGIMSMRVDHLVFAWALIPWIWARLAAARWRAWRPSGRWPTRPLRAR
jgi:hypothetical protein